jgi:hypothetical protein
MIELPVIYLPMKKNKKGLHDEKGRVLCVFCKRPIHVTHLGGVFKGSKGEECWFCDFIGCLIMFYDKFKSRL